MKTAVSYYRYSSLNQKGESIEAQQFAVRNWCEKNEVTLIKEYIDRAESATTDDRTEFQVMMNELLSGIIRVALCLTDKTDRFARNRRDAVVYKYDLNERGILYDAVLMPTHGNIFLQAIYEAKDEDYSRNLSEEVKRKMRTHALKSKHLGGIPPLGLDTKEAVIELPGGKTAAIGKGLDNDDTYRRIKTLQSEREELEVSIKLLKQQTLWTKEKIIKFILANKTAASETSKAAYGRFLINKFVDQVILTPDDIILKYHFEVDNAGGPEGNRTLDLLNAIQYVGLRIS